jgi:hypothetical protein
MWIYKDKEFKQSDIPEGAVGFIYEMTIFKDEELLMYIGKKNFFSDVKTKLGKKEMPTDKRLKEYKRVRKYNYQNYFSSNDVIKEFKKNGGRVDRTIIEICFSKTELTYKECKYQFSLGVLEKRSYLNSNILGKFYNQYIK